MAGLDTIISEILQQGQEKASAVLADAELSKGDILSKAKAAAEEIGIRIRKDADKETADIAARYRSSADMKKKQAQLAARQGMIGGVVEKAYEKVLSMEEGPYFGMLEKLLASRLQAKDGVLFFSEKDLARIPESFLSKATALAAEKGGSVTVSKECRPIDGGFVLTYGGMEENCSIKALFEEKADALSDTVQKILFS